MELQVNLKEWLKKLVYMKTEVDTKLSSKADSNHTHSISNVTNLQTTLNGKANVNHSHDSASSSANGFLSKEDKSKLDGIATEANKTVVDSSLSSSSTNPVQNKVVNSALNGKANVSHTHNDTYYTKSEVDARIGDIETALTNILGVQIKMAFEIGSSNIQELLTHLMNTKLSIKNKIEEVYGQDLTDIIFEEYYRYITTSDDLNPSKNYTEVSNTISGKLFRVNEIKQFLKQTIEEKCKADLTNVVFTDYYMNIKIPDHFTLTLPDGGTTDFYKGWKYRVRVLNNNQPVSNTIVKFTVNGVTYDKTTDSFCALGNSLFIDMELQNLPP